MNASPPADEVNEARPPERATGRIRRIRRPGNSLHIGNSCLPHNLPSKSVEDYVTPYSITSYTNVIGS
jgi:hypothetical protein